MKMFSKDDTWAIKGIAIIMMYWHHCFLDESRFAGCTVNFFPLSAHVGIYLGAFFKICVGTFVFMSAYGITRSIHQRYGDIVLEKKDISICVFQRWFSLMKGWIFVFLLCEIITFFIDRRPLQIYGSTKHSVIYFLMDMLGIADLFHIQPLISTWWYMSLAVLIILLMPLLLMLYKRIGWLMIPLTVTIPMALNLEITNLVRWMLAIVLGIVFAEKNILEKGKAWLHKDNRFSKFIIMCILLCGLIILRQSKFAANWLYITDGIVPAFVILFAYAYIIDLPFLRNVLMFLGVHSMNMFLIHNFIRVTYLYEWTYSFTFAIVDVLVLIIETLLISILIEKMKQWIGYNTLCNKIKGYILSKLE